MVRVRASHVVLVVGLASAVVTLLACGSKSEDKQPEQGDASTFGGSSGTSGTVGTSGGSTSTSSSSSSTTSSSSSGDAASPETYEGCVAACEAKYPAGVLKGKKIDDCWIASCPACQNMPPGQLQPPANGTCQNGVATPAAACSQCTVDKCCAAWDGCFGDAECKALNTCVVACDAKK